MLTGKSKFFGAGAYLDAFDQGNEENMELLLVTI